MCLQEVLRGGYNKMEVECSQDFAFMAIRENEPRRKMFWK